MLVCWANRTNDSFDVPSTYYFFPQNLAKLFAKTLSIDFFIFFYKITKMKIKSFESMIDYEKKILGMSDDWSTSPISPVNQHIIL